MPWAHAQDASPKFEVFAGYSAIETNNHSFHFSHPKFNVTDTDFDEGGRGFEAAITRSLTRYFGVVGTGSMSGCCSESGDQPEVVPTSGRT
jgi:hypothetical protein